MIIIKNTPQKNGAYQNCFGNFTTIPDGWSLIPENINIPDTFPFMEVVWNENNNIINLLPKEYVITSTPKQLPLSKLEKIRKDLDYLAKYLGIEFEEE